MYLRFVVVDFVDSFLPKMLIHSRRGTADQARQRASGNLMRSCSRAAFDERVLREF
jgi:hypothetical protein